MNKVQQRIHNFIKSLTQDEDFIQDLWLFYLENQSGEPQLEAYLKKIQSIEFIDKQLESIPIDTLREISKYLTTFSETEHHLLLLYVAGVDLKYILDYYNRLEPSKLLAILQNSLDKVKI